MPVYRDMPQSRSLSAGDNLPTDPSHQPRSIIVNIGKKNAVALLLALSGCAVQPNKEANPPAADVQAHIVRLLPPHTADSVGWAKDIDAAFNAQHIAPSTENICAVLAVAQQESGLSTDAPVPGLGKIAWRELDRRAAKMHIPAVVVHAALQIKSPDGKTYSARLDNVRNEKELSAIFDDFIAMAPMGQKWFGSLNPVRTGGPMQVSIAFATEHAGGYPYPVKGSIRNEVFSRRGGMYFGILHLLGYPARYPQTLFRFADYNAGWYASRNAAFQHAVGRLTGKPLALDGDLIEYNSTTPGATERAVRTLSQQLRISHTDIRRALDKGERPEFEQTALYQRVFALADKTLAEPAPRAILPDITLESPKITRKLTTAWFARRVEQRRVDCLRRASES